MLVEKHPVNPKSLDISQSKPAANIEIAGGQCTGAMGKMIHEYIFFKKMDQG